MGVTTVRGGVHSGRVLSDGNKRSEWKLITL
jgi:hypothetical protein